MTTAEKCETILKNIVERCNDRLAHPTDGSGSGERVVSFAPDWGGNSLTLYIDDSHTHVGDSSDSFPFERLIDQLHDWLLEGKGLSFQIPIQ